MLEAQHITLAIAGRTLCRDLSVRFGGGENWAILGANGSGKTTLLQVLAGLQPARRGRVLITQHDVRHVPRRALARRLGISFQDSETALPASVLETVLLGRHPFLSRWQREGPEEFERARSALAAVGLIGFEDRLVPTLSGGERRRVDIAMLLAQDPPIALWDEPTNHLDVHHQLAILRLLSARARHPAHLNVFVLHDVNLALRFCSHGLVLLPGGEVGHGPLATLLDATLLGRLYGCPMRELNDAGQRLFLPA